MRHVLGVEAKWQSGEAGPTGHFCRHRRALRPEACLHKFGRRLWRTSPQDLGQRRKVTASDGATNPERLVRRLVGIGGDAETIVEARPGSVENSGEPRFLGLLDAVRRFENPDEVDSLALALA